MLITVWCTGFSLPAFSNSKMLILLLPFIKHMYSNVCHQIAFKSFTIHGHEFLVCARCTGIYTGGLISLLFLLFINKRIELNLRYFLLGALPLFMDVLFVTLHFYQYSKWISSATGFVFGSITIMYILGIIENSILYKQQVK